MSLFEQQSLMFGYSTVSTDIKGRQTVNKPTANVSGMPVYTNDIRGKQSTMYPTENLTGYPVVSTDPKMFSGLDMTAIVQGARGYQILQSSGNITGWPTIYTETGADGNIMSQFVLPGNAPAGSFEYGRNGMPRPAAPKESIPKAITAPKVASNPSPPKVSTSNELTSSNDPNRISQLNRMDVRRRRTSQSQYATFIGDTMGTPVGRSSLKGRLHG